MDWRTTPIRHVAPATSPAESVTKLKMKVQVKVDVGIGIRLVLVLGRMSIRLCKIRVRVDAIG